MVVIRNGRELEAEISRRIKESEKLKVGSEEWVSYCNGTAKLIECRKYYTVSPDTKAKIIAGTALVSWITWYQKHNILDIKPIRIVSDVFKFW